MTDISLENLTYYRVNLNFFDICRHMTFDYAMALLYVEKKEYKSALKCLQDAYDNGAEIMCLHSVSGAEIWNIFIMFCQQTFNTVLQDTMWSAELQGSSATFENYFKALKARLEQIVKEQEAKK